MRNTGLRFTGCLVAAAVVGALAAGEPPRHPGSEGSGSWHWPLRLHLPEEGIEATNPKALRRVEQQRGQGKFPVLVWLPPDAARIRAMLLVSPNTDSYGFATDDGVRAVVARHQTAIVYLRFCPHCGLMEKVPDDGRAAHLEADRRSLAAILAKIAERSGIAEFRHAPFVPLGKSSCGRFPMNIAWLYPDRTVAGITWHGEVPHWPPPAWADLGDRTIAYINVNGQEEWSGTWYRHVRPNLLNYRRHTAWLPHQVVSWGVGHGDYPDMGAGAGGETWNRRRRSEAWAYMALWLDRILALRLPEEAPTEGPVPLRPIDPDSGWLIHPRAIEERLDTRWFAFRREGETYQTIPWPDEKHPVYDPEQGELDPALVIRPATAVPEAERRDLLWVPDREVAEAWLRFHTPEPLESAAPKEHPAGG